MCSPINFINTINKVNILKLDSTEGRCLSNMNSYHHVGWSLSDLACFYCSYIDPLQFKVDTDTSLLKEEKYM